MEISNLWMKRPSRCCRFICSTWSLLFRLFWLSFLIVANPFFPSRQSASILFSSRFPFKFSFPFSSSTLPSFLLFAAGAERSVLAPSYRWLVPREQGNQSSSSSSSSSAGAPPPSQGGAGLLDGVCSINYLNPCIKGASCVPSIPVVGEAVCTCPQGFNGDGREIAKGGTGCVNIDECSQGLHDCDLISQYCLDTPGGFLCKCKAGHHLAPDGITCLDIDECTNPMFNTCNHDFTRCKNTPGSYICECLDPTKYRDEVTGLCRDLNECEDLGGTMNPCEQRCINKEGGAECACEDGFRLAPDGRSCEDVDECDENNSDVQRVGHRCDPLGIVSACVNTRGGHYCSCNEEEGYQAGSDPFTCVNLDECSAYPFICGGPQSCCRDLPPPQKFACVLPLDPTASLPQEIQGSSSSSLSGGYPLGGLYNNPMSPPGYFPLPNPYPMTVASYPTYSYQQAQQYPAPTTWANVPQPLTGMGILSSPALRTPAAVLRGRLTGGGPMRGVAGTVLGGPVLGGPILNVPVLGGSVLGGPVLSGPSGVGLFRQVECPLGFTLGADLNKARVKQNTKENFRNAIESVRQSREDAGLQSMSPEEVTKGLVSSANDVSRQVTNWYSTFASAPQDLAQAAGLSALGGALASGLIVDGANKLKYGGGPAESKYLDRTGQSSEIAYQLKNFAV